MNDEIPDDEIAQRADKILEWNSALPADHIQLSVKAGWITLSGQVDWQYQRNAAEDAVRLLPGVVGIVNNISVKQQVQVQQVKRRIEEALKHEAAHRAEHIDIAVCGPVVTINGKVRDGEERALVRHAAESAPGVRRVEDHLTTA